MSFQEKRSIVYLISNLAVSAGYVLYIAANWGGWFIQTPNDSALWAKVILAYIPVHIVTRILVHILLAIIQKLADPSENVDLEDELDKAIEWKSTRILSTFFMIGFVVALGSLAIGQPLVVFFSLISGTLALTQVISDISQLVMYRRGI